MVKYTHNLTTHHSVMILFCFLHRHEKRRPRDLSHHPPRETSHDVQRHTQQGNPASLQEVHARRKYNHPLLSGPRASSPLHSRSFVPALKCRYRRFLSGCHGRLVWLGHRTLSTGKIDGALWRRLQSVADEWGMKSLRQVGKWQWRMEKHHEVFVWIVNQSDASAINLDECASTASFLSKSTNVIFIRVQFPPCVNQLISIFSGRHFQIQIKSFVLLIYYYFFFCFFFCLWEMRTWL